MGWSGLYWIDVAQDRDQWRALVNTVLNLQVPENAGKYFRGCTIGAPQEGIVSVGKQVSTYLT
jgi:hypothetical protein